MASGIPVICTDLPGLRENCGDAGTYCKQDRLDEWISAIRNVEENYEICSNKAFARAEQLQPENNLINFEQWVTTLTL
jgi:glycosyltransferase involved in cell wall biosynthesis